MKGERVLHRHPLRHDSMVKSRLRNAADLAPRVECLDGSVDLKDVTRQGQGSDGLDLHDRLAPEIGRDEIGCEHRQDA